MKRTLTFFLLFFVFNNLLAQQWSTPINISNQGGEATVSPSFCTDKNGDLHCVWNHKISAFHWKLFIAHSYDQGQTWTTPEDILQNDTLWPCQPKIIADTNNDLHLVYTFNCGDPSSENLYYSMYDGNSWSPPLNISPGYDHSYFGKVVCDHDNSVYCFWLNPFNYY